MPDEVDRPQVAKVVTDLEGNALYFSRAPIPVRRAGGISPRMRAHVGMYAFTADFLERFTALAPGLLEQEESLEQLRALEHGFKIKVAETTYRGFGIDTPEDLERARALLAAGQPEGGPWSSAARRRSTCSSPAAWSARWARAWPPPRSARCWRTAG